VDQIQHILPGLCESQGRLQAPGNRELMDEQELLMAVQVQPVLRPPQVVVAAVLEVLQPEVGEVAPMVSEWEHEIQVRRRIRRNVLPLRSASCRMNKLAVPLPHVVEAVVQLMESPELALVLVLEAKQVEVSVAAEVLVSLQLVLLLHLLAVRSD
jgi:hypothetical protein